MSSPSHAAADTTQVVVVTGASSGIGRAVARAYGRRGARVALLARTEAALATAVDEIEVAGGEAVAIPTDVADADAVDRAAQQVVDRWGQIDVWVNNAMATVFSPIADMTAEEYRRVTEVTYLGTVHGTLAALRHMRPRDAGTIVQVGSSLGYRSIPLQSAYCAGKHAIVGFTNSLRSELIHDDSNIRVTVANLPAVNTPQASRQRNKMSQQAQPVPPMYRPEDIAEQIIWAADHAPREHQIGKPTVAAIWGQKFIPGILDRQLGKKGWDAQLVDQPNTQEGDMLFSPLDADPGAQGPYPEKERDPDLQMRLATHPHAVTGGALAALAGLALGVVTAMRNR